MASAKTTTTKKTTAKKTTTKETKPANSTHIPIGVATEEPTKKNELVNIPEPEDWVIPAIEPETEVNPLPAAPQTVEEAVEKVDVTIDDSPMELDTVKKVEETIEPINEITKEVEETIKEEKLKEAVEKKPEEAERILEAEVKKAQDLKDKVEKIINKPKGGKLNITSWWNGTGYDF